MKTKIHVVKDSAAIEFLVSNDLDGFREYLSTEDYLDFGEPEIFASESEARAYCFAFAHGTDERALPTAYPLRSFEPADAPFIEAIENY